MIFDLDDKKVNVEIPLTAKKLKPEIIDYLYDNYSSDEIYHKLRDYKQEDHYEKPVKTVGIWMSGGADSSLLAYVLAKKIDFSSCLIASEKWYNSVTGLSGRECEKYGKMVEMGQSLHR